MAKNKHKRRKLQKRPRNKVFIPQRGHNPVVLSKKIMMLNANIAEHKEVIKIWDNAFKDYIDLVVNFAAHDLKNNIHNLDGAVFNLHIDTIQAQDIQDIKECMENIRTSLSAFQKLGANTNNIFMLEALKEAAEVLHRGTFQKENIHARYIITKEEDKTVKISQHFYNLLQVINNLISNSVKALQATEKREITLYFSTVNETEISIKIIDNGCGVVAENKYRMFDRGFSTFKEGSGIGLFHSRMVLQNMGGEIHFLENDAKNKTTFQIQFPQQPKI